jgi:hypothetical protein
LNLVDLIPDDLVCLDDCLGAASHFQFQCDYESTLGVFWNVDPGSCVDLAATVDRLDFDFEELAEPLDADNIDCDSDGNDEEDNDNDDSNNDGIDYESTLGVLMDRTDYSFDILMNEISLAICEIDDFFCSSIVLGIPVTIRAVVPDTTSEATLVVAHEAWLCYGRNTAQSLTGSDDLALNSLLGLMVRDVLRLTCDRLTRLHWTLMERIAFVQSRRDQIATSFWFQLQGRQDVLLQMCSRPLCQRREMSWQLCETFSEAYVEIVENISVG